MHAPIKVDVHVPCSSRLGTSVGSALCNFHRLGVSEHALGGTPVGFGIVVEDKNPSELSCTYHMSCTHHAVFTANLFSMDSSSPHNVTTTVGQPVVLSCASSYNSIPAPTFDWVIFTPFQRSLQDSDNAVIGINGSLYVQKPTTEQSGMVFQCRLTNGDRVKTGYVRLIVQGKRELIFLLLAKKPINFPLQRHLLLPLPLNCCLIP